MLIPVVVIGVIQSPESVMQKAVEYD
jgi:hypothetical protein